MIDIAHSLGKRVVAEHVEDAETLEALRSLRVDLVQGYLLGRPMPLADFEKSLPAFATSATAT